MATEEEHLRQFERNHTRANRLAESADYDWGVTALFYASLHLVQAYFVRHGMMVQTHRQRNRRILSTEDLRPVFEPYRALRINSEDARYECRRFSREEFEAIRGGMFESVVTHLQSLRGDP